LSQQPPLRAQTLTLQWIGQNDERIKETINTEFFAALRPFCVIAVSAIERIDLEDRNNSPATHGP
jgi:hypothetical protein